MRPVREVQGANDAGAAREVQLLSDAHAEGLRALCEEPDVAAVVGVTTGILLGAAVEYIRVAKAAQEAGQSFVFVLVQGSHVTGLCRLIGVRGVPRLIVAVGHAWRGEGNGAILVRHVLAFAFETLGLERVTASGACLQIVSRYGKLEGNALTRSEWLVYSEKQRTGSAPLVPKIRKVDP